MLTSFSQFRAQGWKSGYPRSDLLRDKHSQIHPIAEIVSPIIYQDVPSSTVESGYESILSSTFYPTVQQTVLCGFGSPQTNFFTKDIID